MRRVSKTTDKSTLRIPIFKIPSMQDRIVREAAVSTHKQINMPMWRTKSPSISLDFQKQVSHVHKRLSVPAASKTQTRTLIGSSELVQDRDGWVFFFSGKTQITRWLTWHYVTDGDESSVLQTGKITQQLPIKHTVPVPDRIVLKELETWEPYNPPRRSSSLNWCHTCFFL